jgi:hypothetical protein
VNNIRGEKLANNEYQKEFCHYGWRSYHSIS